MIWVERAKKILVDFKIFVKRGGRSFNGKGYSYEYLHDLLLRVDRDKPDNPSEYERSLINSIGNAILFCAVPSMRADLRGAF